jgi:hypothetical protein
MSLTIGHDAEIFVTDERGTIAHAIGLIGGTKENPFKIKDGALQEDNVLAELNIWPADTADAFVRRTNSVMETLKGMLPRGYGVEVKSSHHYTKEFLMGAGDKALEFGCDPDYNCWTLDQNQIASSLTTLRTAGGHVHIGFEEHVDAVEQTSTMRMCDYMLGLPSVLLDPDTERRNLYGSAGAYRPKPYGAEYRVLSNFWLHDEQLMRWVFDNAISSYENRQMLEGYRMQLPAGELQRIINQSDKAAAGEWVRTLNIPMP